MKNNDPKKVLVIMDEEDVIRQLKQRVKDLEARVKELEDEIKSRNEDEAGVDL